MAAGHPAGAWFTGGAQWFCFPIRFPGGSLEAPRSSQDAIPFPIPSSQLVPRMIAKRSFPAPGWVPGLPGLPGLPVGSQDGHPYIRYGNSACRWLHLSVDHMTIGKELLVSNLLTTLLWCQLPSCQRACGIELLIFGFTASVCMSIFH